MVQTVQHIIVFTQFLVCKVIDTPVVQVERVPSAVVEVTAEFGVSTASCGM